MAVSPAYRALNVGMTDRVFLLGHGDGLPLNDPYQLTTIKDAVNVLGADHSCPLLRGALEAYYAGARDIWLMAVAPMSEVDSGDELYHTRLIAGYEILKLYDLPNIIVPLGASLFSEDADFLTQLANHCSESFGICGTIRIGIIGDTLALNTESIAEIIEDERLTSLVDKGKFVFPILGEGVINLQEMPVAYATNLSAVSAGLLSTLRLSNGLTYRKLPNVAFVSGPPLTNEQIDALLGAKLNVAVRSAAGRRGRPFEILVSSDNTLGETGSDFWSLSQVRLVAKIIERVHILGRSHIGTIGYGDFKQKVQEYFVSLGMENIIRDFDLNINRSPLDRNTIDISASVLPYFGIRQISFKTEIGPGT